jgi:hypothetical protein
MSTFYLIDPEADAPINISFAEIVDLAKGASIVNVSESDGLLEIGLSEALTLRFQPRGRLHVTIMSTKDSRGIVPIRFQLIEGGEEPSAAIVEGRLHRLRQIYAISFLVDAGREDELAEAIQESPGRDLEYLLAPEDRLYVQAASPGSFLVTLFGKSSAAQSVLRNLPLLTFPEGRQNLLRRMRAETAVQELEVAKKEASVALKEAEAAKKKVALLSKYLDLYDRIEKIKDSDRKEAAKRLMSETLDLPAPHLPKLSPPEKE